MAGLDKDKIAAIKAGVNIVDVIAQVTPLTKTGRQYLGLCPFHKEKTPSFNVLEDKQFYHCFGCGKSGDVFTFIEETQQVPFMEAVHQLADQAGISLSLYQAPSPSREHPNQKLYDINQDAAKFYHAVLMTTTQGEAAKAYLASRGLDDDLLAYFQIGLAPDEADYLYQSLGKKYDETSLNQSGLFTLTESNQFLDSFRDRIMFPLLDQAGRTVGFSGRIWRDNGRADQKAKYKNTRSTPIFNKSYELYHLDRAKAVIKKTQEVYLMEGFMDVIAAYRAGVVNAVAAMGTALTLDHVRHLTKYAKKVVLTYDGDQAGQAAMAKSLELLGALQVDIVRLPDQMDPDEFLQKHSGPALQKMLTTSRISKVEFLAHHWLPENLDNLQAQIAYVDQLAALIVKEPSLTAQNTYIHLVADLLPDFDYLMVEQVVDGLRQQGTLVPASRQVWQDQSVVRQLPQNKPLQGLEGVEAQLFYRALNNPLVLDQLRAQGFAFSQPNLAGLYGLLQADGEVSRLQLADQPQAWVQTYYQVLGLSLPEPPADGELEELLQRRDHYLAKQALTQQEREIRDYSKHGDLARAEDALMALIAQKRHLE